MARACFVRLAALGMICRMTSTYMNRRACQLQPFQWHSPFPITCGHISAIHQADARRFHFLPWYDTLRWNGGRLDCKPVTP
ncbi:hypothetical protein N656DRAFT_148536 [Canariomyces notabilis]|uniref:Secreted protein n=1 Tax=Canariomyces notabilis TaxID=2074819 RepID=A0AAN6TC79_9PEZI|nr:hypothetical protein N656DRAFT_148536 [Canariomyces arenarius]